MQHHYVYKKNGIVTIYAILLLFIFNILLLHVLQEVYHHKEIILTQKKMLPLLELEKSMLQILLQQQPTFSPILSGYIFGKIFDNNEQREDSFIYICILKAHANTEHTITIYYTTRHKCLYV